MATATMHDPAREAERDKVIRDYEDKLAELRTLKTLTDEAEKMRRCLFWRHFADKMEADRKAKAAEWAEPHFKPKDFQLAQSRVLAIREVMREFHEFADEQKTNFERAWRALASYEGQWALYMGQFQTLKSQMLADIGPVDVAPAPEAKIEDMADNGEPSEVPAILHIVTVPLEKYSREPKTHKNIRKKLMDAGFGFVLLSDGNWHWTADEDDKSGAVYEELFGADQAIVLKVWVDDPAQTEIPMEDEQPVSAQAGEATVEAPWLITTKALEEGPDDDLSRELRGAGFENLTPLNEEEWTWQAPYSDAARDLAESAFINNDQRVLETRRA